MTIANPAPATPDVDVSELTIARLTPEQADRAIATHYLEWGRGLTLAEYMDRAHHKGSADEPWGRDGAWIPWGLVRRSDGQVLAFCCTLRRASTCSAHGAVTSYGIAAVVCPVPNRRKGYARHMLRLLHYVLAPRDKLPPFPEAWGAPPEENLGDAHFSILYSGIGKDYYATCTIGEKEPGWVYPGMLTRVWDAKQEVEVDQEGWEWLGLEGILALEPEMSRRIERDVQATPEGQKPRIAVLPYPTGCLKYMTYTYLTTTKPTPHAGLRLPAPPGGEAPFIVYNHWAMEEGSEAPTAEDLARGEREKAAKENGIALPEEPKVASENQKKNLPRRLAILHVSHGRDADGNVVPFPFSAVLAVANKEGCASIDHWGPGAGWDKEGGGARLEDKDNIPCIARYAGDEEWAFCEAYCWC